MATILYKGFLKNAFANLRAITKLLSLKTYKIVFILKRILLGGVRKLN